MLLKCTITFASDLNLTFSYCSTFSGDVAQMLQWPCTAKMTNASVPSVIQPCVLQLPPTVHKRACEMKWKVRRCVCECDELLVLVCLPVWPCELTDGLDLLMGRYTYCTYTVRLRCAPKKMKNTKWWFCGKVASCQVSSEGGCDRRTFWVLPRHSQATAKPSLKSISIGPPS